MHLKARSRTVKSTGVDVSGDIPVPLREAGSGGVRMELTAGEQRVLAALGRLVEREQDAGHNLISSRRVFEVLDRQPQEAAAGLMKKLAGQGGLGGSIIPNVSQDFVAGRGVVPVGRKSDTPAMAGFIVFERDDGRLKPVMIAQVGIPLLSLPQAWMAHKILNGTLKNDAGEPFIPVGSFSIPAKPLKAAESPQVNASTQKAERRPPRFLRAAATVALGLGLLGFSVSSQKAKAEGPLLLGEWGGEVSLLTEQGPPHGTWTLNTYTRTDAAGLSSDQNEALQMSLFHGWPSLRLGALRTMREGKAPLDTLSAKYIHRIEDVTLKGMIVYTQDHEKDGDPWKVAVRGGVTFPVRGMGDHVSLNLGGTATNTSDRSIPDDMQKTFEMGAALEVKSGQTIPYVDLRGVFSGGVTSYDALKNAVGAQLTPRLPKDSGLSFLNAVTVIGIHEKTSYSGGAEDVASNRAFVGVRLKDNITLHAGVSQTKTGEKESSQAFIGLAIILDRK